MTNINEVMLRRKNAILLGELPKPTIDLENIKSKDEIFAWLPETDKNLILAATVAKNMEALGYTPSKELLDKMIENKTVTAQVAEFVIPELKVLKGADVEYHPMYPNFPQQVMQMDAATLYINAIIHYLTNGHWQPETTKEDRPQLNEKINLTTLSVGTDKTCKALLTNLLNSAMPFSQQDKEDIYTLSEKFNVFKAMPKFIVNRENMATLADMMVQKEGISALKSFSNQVKSVTDVLRIMNLRNGNGDVTLAEPFKGLAKVSRGERRAYLNLIEKCNNAAEDMKINKSLWIKVGQTLHPGEYKDMFPKAYTAFKSIREKELLKEVHTYNAVTENAMRGTDEKALKEAMTEKPGVFARNLDRLVRNSDNPEFVINLWQNLAEKVAPNLLWQVHSHFDRKIKEHDDANKLRIFTIIGKTAKTKVVEDNTKPIPIEICQKIKDITEDALKSIYKEKPPMGKIYVDSEIAHCKVPNDTRDASKGSVPMAKGSRIPLGDNANVIRAFVWWTNLDTSMSPRDRVDIDLSATLLNKDLQALGDISYYNLTAGDYGCFHSGDIVDGGAFDGKGVAEFIDIDLTKAQAAGVEYICFGVHGYTEQYFSKMEHIKFGYMEREKALDGEIFEPSTVQQCIKLNAPSVTAAMCLFDIKNKDMIWMDAVGMSGFRYAGCVNNAATNIRGTQMACYKALHMEKPDIADVIRINVEARGGEFVDNKEEADTIFALNEGIKPTDLDYFAGNLIPAVVSPEYLPEPEQDTHKEVLDESNKDSKDPEEEFLSI